MKNVLYGAWRRYRGLPGWAQVVMLMLTIGLLASAAGDKPVGQDPVPEVAAPIEEQLPRASTTSTTEATSTTSTTLAPVTTTTTTVAPTTIAAPVVTTSAPRTAIRPVVSVPASTAPPSTASPATTAALRVAASTGCHPSYTGACLPPNASDVDCAGGSGNGPVYATEKNFGVVGPDVFDLDRDGDGVACES